MKASCSEHDRGVDDVGRAGSPAQHSRGPGPRVGQRFDHDVASVEQSGQSRLASAASPSLTDDACRHNDRSTRLPGNLDHRGRVTVAPLDRDEGPGIKDQAQCWSASAKRCRARASS